MSLELARTWNESLSRRRIGDRLYAGVPCSGYSELFVTLNPGQSYQLPSPPSSLAWQAVILAADVNTSITASWPVTGGNATVNINLLSVVTPPSGATVTITNTASQGSSPVPVDVTTLY